MDMIKAKKLTTLNVFKSLVPIPEMLSQILTSAGLLCAFTKQQPEDATICLSLQFYSVLNVLHTYNNTFVDESAKAWLNVISAFFPSRNRTASKMISVTVCSTKFQGGWGV